MNSHELNIEIIERSSEVNSHELEMEIIERSSKVIRKRCTRMNQKQAPWKLNHII